MTSQCQIEQHLLHDTNVFTVATKFYSYKSFSHLQEPVIYQQGVQNTGGFITAYNEVGVNTNPTVQSPSDENCQCVLVSRSVCHFD